jgi:hypothetical protein
MDADGSTGAGRAAPTEGPTGAPDDEGLTGAPDAAGGGKKPASFLVQLLLIVRDESDLVSLNGAAGELSCAHGRDTEEAEDANDDLIGQ